MHVNYEPRSRHLPIAIVGAACRLPGSSNVEEFWEVLANGRYTIAEPTADRRATLSDATTIRAGFLDRIDGFDAGFFGMSPHEALRLDPHHRLLLETVWEALEDMGLPPDQLAGSRTGVYTSCFGGHYWQLLQNAGLEDMHAFIGAHRSTAPAGRIAHLLDLRGPTIETESTCASSLVAVHLACQALRVGEISMAIVGGVNLLLSPDDHLGLADAGIISPSYRCSFGDAGADGFVPAEGVVTLVLKPLEEAVAAGDQVYATILGTGVSSNGRQAASASATGTTGQEDLLHTTLWEAGIKPAEVDYVEAHGTGTPSGDEVELTALSRVLGTGRDAGQRCLVGSVKSNIGHTEATAGLAGLLKTALALKHRTIPATLHVRRPIQILEAGGTPIELPRATRPWPERGRPGIAGVTALGMFGVGAHVVLQEAGAPPTPPPEPRRPGRALVLPLSATDPGALRQLAARYADAVAVADDPTDVCFSAGAHRAHHPHRAAVTAGDRETLADRLRRLAAGDPPSAPAAASDRTTRPSRMVFVFSGQGSQWLGMARDLLAAEPVFAGCLRECDELVATERGWSLIDRLTGDVPLTGEYEIQPVLWAIQVSLARLWRHWGIEPDLVVGHSMGEVAAATVAGALTLRDGAIVACRRSAAFDALTEPGAMVAVELDEHTANAAIGGLSDRVSVAVVNSQRSTVLAGPPDALDEVVESLRRQGVYCRPIRANQASHSIHVEPLRETLLGALSALRPRAGEVPLHSTALDRVVPGDELDAGYWMANVRQPVRFASAVQAILADRVPTVFLEISPHPILVPAIEDGIDACGADAVAVPSLYRERPETESLLGALAALYVRGATPAWNRVQPGARYVALPTYPWQRTRFWVESGAPAAPRPAAARPAVPAEPVAPAPEVITSAAALAEYIAHRAAEILAADRIDLTTPLRAAGLDSVLATKLRVRLRRDLDLPVTIGDLLDPRPLLDLAERLLTPTHPAGAPRTPALAGIR